MAPKPPTSKAPGSAPAPGERAAPADLPYSHPMRSGALPTRKPTRFDLAPDAPTRAAIAQALGLLDLPRLRMKGEVRPSGARDFVLEAHLDAVVVQPCSVTLAPVRSTLSEPVLRRYLADWVDPDGDEAEMPEDDSTEALPEVIDLGAVAVEALVLALPLYPRAGGAEFTGVVATPEGAAPIVDADLKPFAGLAALKDRLGPKEGQ